MPRFSLSPAAIQLLDAFIDRRLHAPRDVAQEVALSGVRELGTLNEPMAAPYLLPLFAHGRERTPVTTPWIRRLEALASRPSGPISPVALTAAEVAARLVVAAGPSALVQMDPRLRHSWSYLSIGWADIERLAAPDSSTAFGILAIACSHSDGRIRERAVREIGARRDGQELSFLLLRLDDWVQPVRQLAISLVQSRLSPRYAPTFIGALAILSSLSLKKRASETKLTEWIHRWLLRPEFSNSLREALTNDDRETRLAALSLCTKSPSLAPRDVVAIALEDPDLLVRFRAAQFAASTLQGSDARWFAKKACQDPHARVRAQGLDMLVACEGAASRPKLEAALLDGAEAVRSTARFLLKKMGTADFRTFYLSALESDRPARLRAALAGLEQTGAEQDQIERITPLLGHGSAGVVAAAMRVVARVDREVAHRAALEILRDQRPRAAKAAAALLHRRVRDYDAEALWRSASAGLSAAGRSRSLALLRECTWWVTFPFLAKAIAVEDAEIRSAAQRELAAWLSAYRNARYAPPPPNASQLAISKGAFEAASAAMEPSLRRSTEQVLFEAGVLANAPSTPADVHPL